MEANLEKVANRPKAAWLWLLLVLGAAVAIFVAAARPRHLYLVVQNGRAGYIRGDGSLAIPPQFEDGHGFSDGLAGVSVNGRWG